MSTDLYGVRILAVNEAERRIRMQVFVVYYDTHLGSHQPLPDDRSFFVRVLCDRDALGSDIDEVARFDEAYINRTAFRYIERVVELERKNFPVADYTGFSDFYYERDGRWQDEDKLVQVIYDVFVTDGAYTRAVAVGDSWGTTAYPTQADTLMQADDPHIPDFSDDYRSTEPFPGAPRGGATVQRLSFSADGTRLLVANDAHRFQVLSVPDLAVIAEQTGDEVRDHEPVWTPDGRVGWRSGGRLCALDLDSGVIASLDRLGVQGSSDGTRFLSPHDEEGLRIFAADGTVLFELPRDPGMACWASFDASGDIVALMIEEESGMLVDLARQITTPLSLDDMIFALALSPDARYLLVAEYRVVKVIRLADQEIIRQWSTAPRMVTALAWSPDGQLVATSSCDGGGTHAEVCLHRVGRAIAAAAAQPLSVPIPDPTADITDLVRLYLHQTRRFAPGWQSFIDDDLVDCHLALLRMGKTLDLVPTIKAVSSQIAARADEAVIRHEQGDDVGARAALADAEARLRGHTPAPHEATFLYAPLAAAQHLLGHAAAARKSLKRAQYNLFEETNPFQWRAVIARALLAMGRRKAVTALIEPLSSSHSFGQFHLRLLMELLHRQEWALFQKAFTCWQVAEAWGGRLELEQTIRTRGLTFAEAPAKFRGWLASVIDLSPLAPTVVDPAEPLPETLEGLAARGRWADVYALLSDTQPTLRSGLFLVVARAARQRGDISVMLDMLARVPCNDMNAPGLRALQEALQAMAGSAYRLNHP